MMDYGEFLEHYRLDDMDRVNWLFVKAWEAYKSEQCQLDQQYEEHALYDDPPIKTRDQFKKQVFEYHTGSAENEHAYGFLRLIEDTLNNG